MIDFEFTDFGFHQILKLMSLFCSRIWCRIPHCIWLSYLLLCFTGSQYFFAFHEVDTLEERWLVLFLENFPQFGFLCSELLIYSLWETKVLIGVKYLIFSSFPRFLRWKLRLQIWALSSFLKWAFFFFT